MLYSHLISIQVQCQEADLLTELNAFEEDQVVDDYVEEEVDAVRLTFSLKSRAHEYFLRLG